MWAIADVANFYCSSERVFDPTLRNKPLIVLSNGDGCAIARSEDYVELQVGVFMRPVDGGCSEAALRPLSDLLDAQTVGLDLLPLTVGGECGDAELDGQRKAGAITKAAAVLACLGMKRRGRVSCIGVVGADVEAKFVQKFPGSSIVQPAEQQLLDDLLKIDRRDRGMPDMCRDFVGSGFVTNQREDGGGIEDG